MPLVIVSTDGSATESAPCLDYLRAAGFEARLVTDPSLARGRASDDQVIAKLAGAEAVIAWGEQYNRKVLAGIPDLRVLARSGVGFDTVDVPAASELDKVVTITPTANYEAVAEHTIAFLMAQAKWMVKGHNELAGGTWRGLPRGAVRGKTLGLLGLGRIGRAVAVRASALGMKIVATEMYPDTAFVEKYGITLLPMDEMLSGADYVSLHCPLNDETRGIINREALARMPEGSVLINTARGGLVVEADVVASLASGHLGGAALDVFEQEPIDPNNPLLAMENVIVSPHIAGSDKQSLDDMGMEAAQNIIDLSQGKWPGQAVVNKELEGKWRW